jgi:antitoxin PrlF
LLKILLLVQVDFSKPSFEQITNRHHSGTFAVPVIGIDGLAVSLRALPGQRRRRFEKRYSLVFSLLSKRLNDGHNSVEIHGWVIRFRLNHDQNALHLLKCKAGAITMEAILSGKNQARIPKQVREYLKLKAGDPFKFFLQPDGTVVILPKIRTSKLKGSVPKLERPVSVEEVEVAIGAGATERHRR